jgi:hypothetical protein
VAKLLMWLLTKVAAVAIDSLAERFITSRMRRELAPGAHSSPELSAPPGTTAAGTAHARARLTSGRDVARLEPADHDAASVTSDDPQMLPAPRQPAGRTAAVEADPAVLLLAELISTALDEQGRDAVQRILAAGRPHARISIVVVVASEADDHAEPLTDGSVLGRARSADDSDGLAA